MKIMNEQEANDFGEKLLLEPNKSLSDWLAEQEEDTRRKQETMVEYIKKFKIENKKSEISIYRNQSDHTGDYTISILLPNVNKSEIKLDIVGYNLILNYTKETILPIPFKPEENFSKIILCNVPNNYDIENSYSKLDNGVLFIYLRKLGKHSPNKTEIKIN